MTKKRESQQQVLEKYRGEMSKVEFCAELGISRPTFDRWLEGAEISLKSLSLMAIDHVGEWMGDMATDLIRLVDPRMVPCVCQTNVHDSGDCPRHGVAPIVLDEPVFFAEAVA